MQVVKNKNDFRLQFIIICLLVKVATNIKNISLNKKFIKFVFMSIYFFLFTHHKYNYNLKMIKLHKIQQSIKLKLFCKGP